jgi:hypothetical protein
VCSNPANGEVYSKNVTDLIIKWPGRVDSSYATSGIDSEELTVPMPLVASIVKS